MGKKKSGIRMPNTACRPEPAGRQGFKVGQPVRVIPQLRCDPRFGERVGHIVGYTSEPYWIGKGTPVEVEFDYGQKPKKYKPLNFGGRDIPWKRYASYFFSEKDLLLVSEEKKMAAAG
jgi:hypothetical protein